MSLKKIEDINCQEWKFISSAYTEYESDGSRKKHVIHIISTLNNREINLVTTPVTIPPSFFNAPCLTILEGMDGELLDSYNKNEKLIWIEKFIDHLCAESTRVPLGRAKGTRVLNLGRAESTRVPLGRGRESHQIDSSRVNQIIPFPELDSFFLDQLPRIKSFKTFQYGSEYSVIELSMQNRQSTALREVDYFLEYHGIETRIKNINDWETRELAKLGFWNQFKKRKIKEEANRKIKFLINTVYNVYCPLTRGDSFIVKFNNLCEIFKFSEGNNRWINGTKEDLEDCVNHENIRVLGSFKIESFTDGIKNPVCSCSESHYSHLNIMITKIIIWKPGQPLPLLMIANLSELTRELKLVWNIDRTMSISGYPTRPEDIINLDSLNWAIDADHYFHSLNNGTLVYSEDFLASSPYGTEREPPNGGHPSSPYGTEREPPSNGGHPSASYRETWSRHTQVLNNNNSLIHLTSDITNLPECIKSTITCPITQDFINDPVVAKDGKTYERQAIVKWFKEAERNHKPITSPWTRQVMDKTLIENTDYKNLLRAIGEEFKIEFYK